jgi:N-acetylglucosamine-6-phosphate deacetylase
VVVDGASVSEVGTGPPPALAYPVLDLGDMLVAPGLVDMHVHGGGGYEVNCATAGEVELSVREMARFHARHGTTALVATTVSDSLHPAEVLGESRKGRLGPGADADIVVLDPDFSVVCTIVGGQVAHDPAGMLRLLAPAAREVQVP